MKTIRELNVLSKRAYEAGATATEYAVMISAVAIILIGAISFFGGWLDESFGTLSSILRNNT